MTNRKESNQNQDLGKKYTVYEIEKLTKGKLTKYKLTKAILNNELKAEKVLEKKRGRGIPNYFVYEADLNDFLQSLERRKKRFIPVPDETLDGDVNEFSDVDDEFKDLLQKNIDNFRKLETKLNKIESGYDLIIPLLESNRDLSESRDISAARKEIINELNKIPSFMVKKRKELLSKLHKIV